MFLMVIKTFFLNIFFHSHFFINDYFGSEYFFSKFKPFSNRPSYTKACCQKSWGLWGDFLQYSAFKVSIPCFPKITVQ
jgi:hypothetical protein